MTATPATFEILLVEDNRADITLVREALKGQGLTVNLHVKMDGAEAIDFIQQLDRPNAPKLDLILLDMHLPKWDGEDILRALRSTEHNAQTPVIVMTSSNAPRDRHAAERHAALHYFTKPSDLESFLQLGALVQDVLLKRKPASPGGSAA